MDAIQVKFDRTDIVTNYNFEIGKRFYLGYVNDNHRQVSILFENLDWLKERFGENLERINDGRKIEIEDLKLCLEHNIPRWELGHLNRTDGKFYTEIKKVEFKPYKLSKGGREQFEKNIANGLLVLCELV